jgi:methyl-accepting chemotaxis protein
MAKDASSSRDKLIEIFNRIERFFHRLEIYTGITPTAAMRGIIIEIMVEVLTILAITTKEVKRGRLSRSILHRFTILELTRRLERVLKTLTGNTDLEDRLDKLDKLTQEEARMASAELLKMTHSVDIKVMGVDDRVKGVEEKVQGVCDDVQDVRDDVRDVRDDVRSGVQDVRDDVQDIRDDMQDVGSEVQNIDRRVQGVDAKLDQANRSLSL